MNTCFPCVLRVSAPAEKYAMLFVSADFISVTRHCRSCCLLFLLLLLLPPTHAHTYALCLLYVCFPLPVTFCHRLPSPCVASRRSACAITSIINPFSFQMARHAQRHSHYHSVCPSASLSLSLFRHFVLLLWSHFVGGGSWQRLFRLCLYLCFALAIVCYCLRFVGHSAAPRCAAQGSDIYQLSLPLPAHPLGPSAQAAAGSVSFLRFARFTALPAALTDCIWQRLKIVVETSLLRSPFPSAAGLFIFVISSLRRSLNG